MIDDQIWYLGADPRLAIPTSFDRASDLVAVLVQRPEILSGEWMIIGAQEDMGAGRRADLVSIDASGTVRLIEVANQMPSRDAFLLLLPRADWLTALSKEALASMYERFCGGNLKRDFAVRFDSELPDDRSGELVLMTADNDPRVTKAAVFLQSRGIAVTIIRYALFEQEGRDPILRCRRVA